LLLSYFNEAFKVFADAAKNTSAVDQCYTIANHTVRLRFAGQTLLDALAPALEHLVAESVSGQALTVCLWDSASTKTLFPPFPWEENATIATTFQNPNEGTNPVIYFKDERILGAYQIGTKTLSMLDTELNTAIFWVPDAGRITYYERSSPLRTIFQWWAKKYSLQLLHAGAVGTNAGGILLVGEGGSGKSTTALACLDSELSYVSDDYCLLDMDSHPYAHSVYCSAKISREGVVRFPYLVSAVENKERLQEEKALLFLNKHWPKKVTKGFPVRALLIPRIMDIKRTNLIPTSPRNGLMALAPSTLFQLRGACQADLTFMAELTRLIPSFILELGNDTSNIPNFILELVSKN
jgi:hypothetical protein